MDTATVMLIFGILLFGIVLVGMLFYLRGFFSLLNVRKHGERIVATVTKIDSELVVSARGHTTAYYVEASWEDPVSGKAYTFRSDAGGISLAENHPPGSAINVLIDPRNPSRYEIPLQFEERSYI